MAAADDVRVDTDYLLFEDSLYSGVFRETIRHQKPADSDRVHAAVSDRLHRDQSIYDGGGVESDFARVQRSVGELLFYCNQIYEKC